jgi:hypothetical protein
MTVKKSAALKQVPFTACDILRAAIATMIASNRTVRLLGGGDMGKATHRRLRFLFIGTFSSI